MSMNTRQLLGSIGGHESWARTVDRTARTEPGRSAFMAKFEREVDPDGVLPSEERLRRAQNAKSAYFKRMAHKSAMSRRSKLPKEPRSLSEFLAVIRRGQTPAGGDRWFSTGCCICGVAGSPSSLVVDHDHATGLVRGTLCRSCNTLEGLRSDSDDFGFWALWRATAPGLGTGEIYVPLQVRHWLAASGLTVVRS